MGKHFSRIAKNNNSALAPYDGLMDDDGLKAKFESLDTEGRWKLTSFLFTTKTAKQVAEIIGTSKEYVYKAAHLYPEIYQAAQMTRQSLVSELAERKTIEILESLDAKNVADDRKAISAKHLMETSDLASPKRGSGLDDDGTTTAELIFRVKGKMIPCQIEPKVIDIIDKVDGET